MSKPNEAAAPAPERQRAVAICWFRREDYDAAKAEMADPDRLYEDYDEWLQEAQAFEAEMTGRGIKTVRIRYEPVGFSLFCLTRGITPDGAARAEWAAAEASKRYSRKR
ncbi:hypothetical protein [Prosthecomicrobium sp. N25]|uniref:hypothetical protein n=1 Tax=Prosthecomicrobium sp. N25 TaxID=3129254 RepID=UPI0030786504